MTTETEEKKQAEQTEETPVGDQQTEENSKPEKEKKPRKERNLLLTIVTVLFVLVGIAELGLWGCTGFGIFRGSQARRAYEAQQAALQNGADRPTGINYGGPWLIVENGEVVWRWTDDLEGGLGSLAGSGSTQSGTSGTGGGNTADTIPRGLWIPYPLPPWARETTTQQTEQPNVTQPEQAPVQT